MNRSISSSGGRYSGGGGRNGLTSWNEDHLSYVNNHKCSNAIIGHDGCWRRTCDFIVKVQSEDRTRNDHSCLEDIHVEYDMEDDMGYDGESRRSSSFSRCGGEWRERDEGRG